MPIYEFKCPECDGRVDIGVSPDDKWMCPNCDVVMVRVYTAPATTNMPTRAGVKMGKRPK